MRLIYFITHPEVVIDPKVPVPQWALSERGQERMKKLLIQPWIGNIGSIYSSAEQKAIDGARILAEHLGIGFETIADLGEIDRSSTGYLPQAEHDAAAVHLFDYPDQSIRGWETANEAQRRIMRAVEAVIGKDQGQQDIAIVSHGGVGTLYLCHLKGYSISREFAQPGTGGGNYYCFEAQSRILVQDWKPIDI